MSASASTGSGAPPPGRPGNAARALSGRDAVGEAVIGLVCATPLLFLLDDSAIPTGTRLLAALTWILCLLPMIGWIRAGRSGLPLPVLPVVGFWFGVLFPLQAVVGATNLYDMLLSYSPAGELDPTTAYAYPVFLCMLGWCALLSGYGLLSLVLGGHRPVKPPPLPAWITLGRRGVALAALGVVVLLAGSRLGAPRAVMQFLSLAGNVGVLLAAALYLQKRIPAGYLLVAAAIYVASLVGLAVSSGAVAPFATAGQSAVVLYYIVKRRTPLWLPLLVVPFAAGVLMLKGANPEFRGYLKTGDLRGETLTTREKVAAEFGFVGQDVAELGIAGAFTKGLRISAGRTALLDLFADVARRTPSIVPYTRGDNYKAIAGSFVPRFLWPDKPVKDMGQYFGHRYGFLSPDDLVTTVNCPFLIEAFFSYGEGGVIGVMFVVGLVIRLTEQLFNRRGQDVVRTTCGLVFFGPIMFNVESDASLVYGGVPLLCLAFLMLDRILIWRDSVAPRPAREPAAMVAR